MPDPSPADPYLAKGKAALEQQQFDYAIELFSHALTLQPESAEARHLIRVALQRRLKQQPASPLARLTRALQTLWPSLQATIAEMRRDFLRASHHYETALRHDPTNVRLLTGLARALMQLRFTAAAITTLEEIHELDPKHLFALRHLGQLNVAVDRYDEARRYYDAVLKLAPRDIEAERALKNLDALGTIRQTFKPTGQ
jgi:tetratricopeptide (TPR) repeat protein